MRLFFATFPDEETRHRIAAAADALGLGSGAKCVPPENYHMTLVFAGEVSKAQAAALREVGPIDIPAFVVCLDILQHWLEAQVLVIAASDCLPALSELHCKLRNHLARAGLMAESRPYNPHVTIARKVTQPPVHQVMSRLLWAVTNIRLVSSMRSDTGSVYTVIDQWQLLDNPQAPNKSP